MIHFIQRIQIRRVGLNLTQTRGGFVATWVWFDVPTYTLSFYRFRLRVHIRPYILWSVDHTSIIQDYLRENELALINREVLADLKDAEEADKRTNEPLAYIKPQ